MKRPYALMMTACTIALCLVLAGCGNPAPDASAASSASNTTASENTQAADAPASVSASDLADVDTVIEYGDYEAMKELSANIQNARSEGSVVQVDGLVVNYGSSYGIVEPNEDNSKRIGTVFVIEGAADDAYPQDGQRVKITGTIGSDETGYTSFIKTSPEYVEVIG